MYYIMTSLFLDEIYDGSDSNNKLFTKSSSAPYTYTLKRSFNWYDASRPDLSGTPLGWADYYELQDGETLDGAGFTITYTSTNSDHYNCVGNFTIKTGITNWATIKNLNVAYVGNCVVTMRSNISGGGILRQSQTKFTIFNCSMSGTLQDGSGGAGIVGYNCGLCTIHDCSSSALINSNCGGIVGSNAGTPGLCTIYNCYSTGNITGGGGIVAGSAGSNGSCVIYNCYSTGDIDGSGGGIGGNSTGGSVGNCTIYNCYSTGLISNSSGGIVAPQAGSNGGNCIIYNCYSTGTINSQSGGIASNQAGYQFGTCIIANCYSTGDITGNMAGGIVATDTQMCLIANCYSIGAISGSSAGGICSGADSDTIIYNCLSTGALTGTDAQGIIKDATMTKVYNCTCAGATYVSGNLSSAPTGPITKGDNTWTLYLPAGATNIAGATITNKLLTKRLNNVSIAHPLPENEYMINIVVTSTSANVFNIQKVLQMDMGMLGTTAFSYDPSYERWITEDGSAVPNALVHPLLTDNPSCFNAGTKICILKDGSEQYELVENLRVGDSVKTYLHGYKKIIIMGKGTLTNRAGIWTNCMWKLSKDEFPEATEDLYVTGGHCFLVDDLKDEYDIHKAITHDMVDGKHMAIAGKSKRTVPVEGANTYTYYHFALENGGNQKVRYGVYANGILMETPPEEHFYWHPYELVK